ncbi:hypothetical protein AGMMS49975_14330 [Clostridia bacterium]|nr:hypothetical protein AGMMS49975_14330 [Clostridia bacterium]
MEINQLKVIIPETSANLVGSEIVLSLENGEHTVSIPFRSENSSGEFLLPYHVSNLRILWIPFEEDLDEIVILSGSTLNLAAALREINQLIMDKIYVVNNTIFGFMVFPKSLYHGSIIIDADPTKEIKRSGCRNQYINTTFISEKLRRTENKITTMPIKLYRFSDTKCSDKDTHACLNNSNYSILQKVDARYPN